MGVIEGILTIAGVVFLVQLFSFVLLRLAGYRIKFEKFR